MFFGILKMGEEKVLYPSSFPLKLLLATLNWTCTNLTWLYSTDHSVYATMLST